MEELKHIHPTSFCAQRTEVDKPICVSLKVYQLIGPNRITHIVCPINTHRHDKKTGSLFGQNTKGSRCLSWNHKAWPCWPGVMWYTTCKYASLKKVRGKHVTMYDWSDVIRLLSPVGFCDEALWLRKAPLNEWMRPWRSAGCPDVVRTKWVVLRKWSAKVTTFPVFCWPLIFPDCWVKSKQMTNINDVHSSLLGQFRFPPQWGL